ncbi:glycosyltransferase family 32 protein [Flavobacterium sp. CGRL2]
MIPKTIHICWFSGEEYTPFIKECIETWKIHLPEFNIRLWDKDSFDFDSIPFVKEALLAKKWAFAADYIRLYALYTEGGLYLDSDVRILKPFKEEWFDYGFFSAHEIHPGLFEEDGGMQRLNSSFLPKTAGKPIMGFAIQGAIFASVPKHPYIKDCLDQYKNLQLFADDGTIDLKKSNNRFCNNPSRRKIRIYLSRQRTNLKREYAHSPIQYISRKLNLFR